MDQGLDQQGVGKDERLQLATHEVIYLTGAPATGKSTVARALAQTAGSIVFSYGEVLTKRLLDRVSDQAELRARSSRVIDPDDVVAVDRQLFDLVSSARHRASVVVDSHAVTIESFGFRAVPYSAAELRSLSFSWIICLYARPEVIQDRIRRAPGGRPLPSVDDLSRHEQLQSALALSYAHTLGIPIAFVNSEVEPELVVKEILRVTALDQVSAPE